MKASMNMERYKYREMSGSQSYLQSHSRSFNRLVQVQVEWHEHPLVHLSLPNLYTCGACKESGAGNRLSCQTCAYELHQFCGKPPTHLKLHPLHPQHQLLLHLPKPSGGGILKSKCDVCGKPSKGLTYRCNASGCSYQLHPTCAMLSPKTHFPHHHDSHPLILTPPDSTTTNHPCGECKRGRRPGQLYTCTVPSCNYVLHAACAKTMVNGLLEHGFNARPNDRSATVLGAAARIASHVVIGFIGGIVEGIGEGVGDALTQSIVSRGGPSPSRARTSRSPIATRRSFVN